MSLKVLIIALAAVAALATGGCKDGVSMTAFYSKLDMDAPVLLETPETLESSSFCPSIQGKSTCCSTASFRAMEDAHTEYAAQIKATFLSLIEQQVSACDKLDAIDRTSKLGYKFERERADTIVTLGQLAEKCQAAAVEYTRSSLCMTCDADLSEYVEDGKVFIDEADLAAVSESCVDFFGATKKFEATLRVHERRLLAISCKHHQIALSTEVDAQSVSVCIPAAGSEESFRKYVSAVAQAVFEKYEINQKYEVRYAKGVVSVCDENGCETQKLPVQASKLFGKEFNTEFVQSGAEAVVAEKRVATPEVANWEDSIIAGFFDVEVFTKGEQPYDAILELVEEGGYKSVQVFQTSTTTTTTKTNTTGTTTGTTTTGTTASAGLAGAIKDKLANSSGQIDAFYQTTSGALLQVMFAAMTIATAALLI